MVDDVGDALNDLDRPAVMLLVVGMEAPHRLVEPGTGGHEGDALPLRGAERRLDLGVGRGPLGPGGDGVAVGVEDVRQGVGDRPRPG
jgi:hypothetical protein